MEIPLKKYVFSGLVSLQFQFLGLVDDTFVMSVKVFMNQDFTGVPNDAKDKIVGTRSIMKFASINIRRSGYAHKNINPQGIWKRFKQIVDIYIVPHKSCLGTETVAAL